MKVYMMRSDCPVSYALDFFGDKWSLLVVRDLLEGKRFYKDFLQSKEGIATNILSDRLKKLEANKIIVSKVFEERKTMREYSLTKKGKALIPVVVEMIIWSANHETGLAVTEDFLKRANTEREELIEMIESRLD